jgi:hypothetical protein
MMYVKFSTKIDDFVEIGDTTWLPEAIQVSDLSNTIKKSSPRKLSLAN